MPPQRTMPAAKPVKTERTHEENQERAYIAASRRSDRSLEARVESARRASEIHKRRTGRSLRVTEQDVVNEEMYEEEDDDLPMQYRRLTAHLQTGSADFDRRLAAYLTNHVAMRSALDQAITSSYAQQYPNAPQFAHNQSSMFPSPMSPQHMMRNAYGMYRQSPYPTPNAAQAAFRPPQPQSAHVRSSSIATPQDLSAAAGGVSGPPTPVGVERRMSLPASAAAAPRLSPPQMRSPSGASPVTSPPVPQFNQQQQQQQQRRRSPTSQERLNQQQQQQQQHAQQFVRSPYDLTALQGDGGMFSRNFSSEPQFTLDPTDPLTSMFMAGSGQSGFNSMPSYYDVMADPGANLKASSRVPHPSFDGINATLAPSALDLTPPSHAGGTSTASSLSMPEAFSKQQQLAGPFDDVSDVGFKPPQLSRTISTQGSGIGDDWGAFIEDNSWE